MDSKDFPETFYFGREGNSRCVECALLNSGGGLLATANETYFSGSTVRDHLDRGGGIWDAGFV